MKYAVGLVGVLLLATNAYAFEDSRDFKKSKAKSYIRQLHKKLNEVDNVLADKSDDKFRNMRWFERRFKTIEKNLGRIPDKDGGWDLSKEKAHFEKQKADVTVAIAAYNKKAMEDAEPDPVEQAVTPYGGAPEMKAGKPDWCDAAEVSASDSWIHKRYYDEMVTKLDDRALVRQAEHPCRAPDFDKRQKWSKNWRQTIANATGADAELVSRFYRVLLQDKAADGKLSKANCKQFENKKRAGQRGGHPREKDFKRAKGFAVGCEGIPVLVDRGDIYFESLFWWFDEKPTAPSELVRVMFILDQIDLGVTEGERRSEKDVGADVLKSLGTYALVQNDIAQLDKAKFDKELEALGINEYGKVMAEMNFAKAKHYGRVFAMTYKEMAPAIQELAFQTPKKGYDSWMADYEANKSSLEKAWNVEQMFYSGKKSDYNCHKELHTAFTKYVSSKAKSKKSKEDKEAVVKDPIAHVLLRGSMTCASFDGKFNIASTLYNQGLNNVREWRGPRTAAYWAMLERFSELKAKDGSLPLSDSDVGFWLHAPKSMQYQAYENTFNKTKFSQAEEGRVKSVRKTKGGVKLTFRTESWKQTIWNCKETRRIDRITSDGKIIYRKKCKSAGSKTMRSTVKPFVVPTQFAAGIKAGSFVRAAVSSDGKKRRGLPYQVFKSSKQKRFVGALGAAF